EDSYRPLTETVALFEAALPTIITTGYSPEGRSGTCKFACASPTYPGASPEYSTVAGCPPMAAVVDATVVLGNSALAGATVVTGLSTWPCPVQKMEISCRPPPDYLPSSR